MKYIELHEAGYNIIFSKHAKERLRDRTSMSSVELRDILGNKKFVHIVTNKEDNRTSILLYSEKDDKFFIVLQNISGTAIITILPIEYWYGSNKWQKLKKPITPLMFKEAMMKINPKNPKLERYRLINPKFDPKQPKQSTVIKFFGIYDANKYIGLGSININDFLLQSAEDILKKIASSILTNAKNKDINVNDIKILTWKHGNSGIQRVVDFSSKEKIYDFIYDIKNYIKQVLTK